MRIEIRLEVVSFEEDSSKYPLYSTTFESILQNSSG
jgi:hypothetical protein